MRRRQQGILAGSGEGASTRTGVVQQSAHDSGDLSCAIKLSSVEEQSYITRQDSC